MVSIITIFLNEERFLQEAIDSVRAQTSGDWELLLIDDGSTDASPAIARKAAEADPARIRYLTHGVWRNRGKSISRNLGLEKARGEHITFLDGDDVFRPEKIERQAAILARTPAAMVYGPTLYWRNWPGAPAGQGPDTMGKLGVPADQLYQPPQLLKLFLVDGGTVPCICGLTVRRPVALEVGGFDTRIHHLYEDQVFLAKVCARYPVFVESGCWDQYRQHPQSTSHRAIAEGTYHPTQPNASQEAYLTWLEGYVTRLERPDPELSALVARALYPYRYPRLHSLMTHARLLRENAANSSLRILRRARAKCVSMLRRSH